MPYLLARLFGARQRALTPYFYRTVNALIATTTAAAATCMRACSRCWNRSTHCRQPAPRISAHLPFNAP